MISHTVPSHESGPPGTPAGEDEVDGVAVERFLRANPAFLAARPGLFASLDPPHRVHGERMADHMHAMLRAERARTAAALSAVPERREAAGMAARVQRAVLALMAAADTGECVENEFPFLLGIDAARFLPGPMPGCAEAAMAGNDAVVRPATPATRPLHAEAGPLAVTEALVRVPLPGGPALLALACRDGRGLGAHAVAELAFLGRAVAASLSRS